MTNQFMLGTSGLTRVAGICGILLPVVMFGCLGLSIASSPWFTWTDHALSDLGIQGHTAALFNFGMIIGGVLTFIFSLGLIKVLSNKIGAYLLTFSSFALIGIGVFPETVLILHSFTSASFFVMLTLALLVIGMTIKQNRFERTIGMLALLVALIAMSSSVFLFQLKGVALPEAFSCFPWFIWCLVVGVKMILV
jgi:hypothetical membrane protein